MPEAASTRDLQRREHPSPYHCQHCGGDTREKRYSWRLGDTPVFGCCTQSLIDIGGDPDKIVAQVSTGLFGKPEHMLKLVAARSR